MRSDRGFTLLEILVSLALMALIVVGALGVVGAAGGGLMEAFPTGFLTGRAAKDITAGSVYVQAFLEHVAAAGSASLPDDAYCLEPPSGCTSGTPLPGSLGAYPVPSVLPYQLNWTRLDVVAETWHWDLTNHKYCLVGSPGCAAPDTTEPVKWVRAELTWTLKGVQRSVRAERFIP